MIVHGEKYGEDSAFGKLMSSCVWAKYLLITRYISSQIWTCSLQGCCAPGGICFDLERYLPILAGKIYMRDQRL